MAKLTFEMSEDARLLSQRLLKAEVGELLTYNEIRKIIGKEYWEARSALQTARRIALRDEGFVFGVERGTGLKRLTDDEIVSSSAADRKYIRNKSKRAIKHLNAVDYRILSASRQLTAAALISIYHATKAIVADQSVHTMQAVVGGSSKSLPIKETLQALLRSQEA